MKKYKLSKEERLIVEELKTMTACEIYSQRRIIYYFEIFANKLGDIIKKLTK